MAAAQDELFPGHDGGQWARVPSKVVATWPAGSFAENLAVLPDGAVLVSLHSHNRIDRYDPATGTVSAFAELPAPRPACPSMQPATCGSPAAHSVRRPAMSGASIAAVPRSPGSK